MWIHKKRPKKVMFYASLLSKMNVLSEQEKKTLIEKQK